MSLRATANSQLGRRALLGGLAVGAAFPAFAQRAGRQQPTPQLTVRPARPLLVQPMRVMTGAPGGTFVILGADLSDLMSRHGFDLRAVGSHGSADNARALVAEQGVDLAFVATDSMALARMQPGLTSYQQQVRYVAKLGTNDLHVIAKDPAINTATDLAGRRVVIDVADSGTAVTAPFVLGVLGVRFVPVYETPRRGMALLQTGEVDAVCYGIGKPGALFSALPRGAAHFVSVPMVEALAGDYLPTTFGSDDYPALIPEGQAIDGVSIGVALACYDWPAATERHAALAQFCRLLVENFDELRQPSCHPQWRSVSLAATLPGWRRFTSFDDMLRDHRARREGAFDAFLSSIGKQDVAGDRRDSLRVEFEGLKAK